MSAEEYREPVLPADFNKWCEFSNDKDFETKLPGRLVGYLPDAEPLDGPWISYETGAYWHCRIKVEAPQS